eukprot:2881957-Alexandrium_andersonii.AAC.1
MQDGNAHTPHRGANDEPLHEHKGMGAQDTRVRLPGEDITRVCILRTHTTQPRPQPPSGPTPSTRDTSANRRTTTHAPTPPSAAKARPPAMGRGGPPTMVARP